MSNSPCPALVKPEWVFEHLADSDMVLLDASYFLPNQNRDARSDYGVAHLPGAGFFDIDEVADHGTPLPHMLPKPEQFAAAVGALGIGNQTHVIAYDSNFFMASARLWWTFRVFGHDRISVLDGGQEAWKAKGFPLTSAQRNPIQRAFEANFRAELVTDMPTVRSLIGSDKTQIVDARSPGRFKGKDPEPRPGLRSGHIPGSRNLFFKDLVDSASLQMRPIAALKILFADAGINVERDVITTCGTGVTASILALGLFCLGNHRVAVYDGSWTEWGGQPDTPVATS
jgi:thiosulfate/3-mercaptopyruvate sulfurtransferase